MALESSTISLVNVLSTISIAILSFIWREITALRKEIKEVAANTNENASEIKIIKANLETPHVSHKLQRN